MHAQALAKSGHLSSNVASVLKEAIAQIRLALSASSHSPSGEHALSLASQEMDPARVEEIVQAQLKRSGRSGADACNILGSR
jgi:hypothetical protein